MHSMRLPPTHNSHQPTNKPTNQPVGRHLWQKVCHCTRPLNQAQEVAGQVSVSAARRCERRERMRDQLLRVL